MLPDLISSNQTTHVKNIYLSENGGLICEVLETVSIFGKKGFLITVDIQKAFNSVDNSFFISCFTEVWF